MREAGQRYLKNFSNYVSIAGTAEDTTLSSHSIDFVTAAQAAHWFDPERARREFGCILKPGGWTVLLWNERRTQSTPFLEAYEKRRGLRDRKSTSLNSSHRCITYAVFCLK